MSQLELATSTHRIRVSDDVRYLTIGQVKRRYGDVSDMWVWLHVRDHGFPKPLQFGGPTSAQHWLLSEIEQWEIEKSKQAVDVRTGLLANDAAWCRANLEKGFGDLPLRPADNRCELCGNIYKAELRWDLDIDLRGLHAVPLEACFRGWVCRGCHNLLKWTNQIGREKLFAYLDRGIAFGDNPAEYPADGRCELCERWCGEKLNRDHSHQIEALGFTVFDSRRGYLCQPCNTDKVARIDRIGVLKFHEHLDRARKKFVLSGR